MKPAHILKPPGNSKAKAVDPDNPPWREEMLGPPVLRRGRVEKRKPRQ